MSWAVSMHCQCPGSCIGHASGLSEGSRDLLQLKTVHGAWPTWGRARVGKPVLRMPAAPRMLRLPQQEHGGYLVCGGQIHAMHDSAVQLRELPLRARACEVVDTLASQQPWTHRHTKYTLGCSHCRALECSRRLRITQSGQCVQI